MEAMNYSSFVTERLRNLINNLGAMEVECAGARTCL